MIFATHFSILCIGIFIGVMMTRSKKLKARVPKSRDFLD